MAMAIKLSIEVVEVACNLVGYMTSSMNGQGLQFGRTSGNTPQHFIVDLLQHVRDGTRKELHKSST
jgi:hypothetical protein